MVKKRFFKTIPLIIATLILLTGAFAFSACDDPPAPLDTFDETVKYDIDVYESHFMDISPLLINLGMASVLDAENTYFEFTPDGKLHGQLQTKAGLLENIDSLQDRWNFNIGDMLARADLTDALDSYAEPMFPGFKEKFLSGDVKGAFELVRHSFGVNIEGIDYEDAHVKQVIDTMLTNYRASGRLRLPSNLLDDTPADSVFRFTMDWDYHIESLITADGQPIKAIYVGGAVAKNSKQTQPFAIFTLGTNEDGVDTMVLRVEFLNIDFALIRRAE